jgi:hypothetical protein
MSRGKRLDNCAHAFFLDLDLEKRSGGKRKSGTAGPEMHAPCPASVPNLPIIIEEMHASRRCSSNDARYVALPPSPRCYSPFLPNPY